MAVKFELPFTQNSHVVAIVCVLVVTIFLSPIGGLQSLDKSEMMTSLLRLAHLSCFASWLGVQIWVTFFAGVTMFRHLPRRTFGFIQSKLFPKYFMLGTVLTSVTISTYIFEHPYSSWEFNEKVQGYSLCVSFVMVLLNLLYLEPQTSKTAFAKNELEKESEAGKDIGKVEDDKLLELNKNAKYAALKKRFIVLHSVSSVANLVALSAQCLHLWHLASHLSTL